MGVGQVTLTIPGFFLSL